MPVLTRPHDPHRGLPPFGDLRRRDRLVQEHVSIVRDVVARIGGCLPEFIDFGDLAGHALATLIDAASDFAGPISHFAEYVRSRVTRTVVACVTGHVWYTTCARADAIALRDAYADLRRRTGVMPSDAAFAESLDLDMSGLEDRLSTVSAVMSIEPPVVLAPAQGPHRLPLREAISALPELERTVCALYYQDELSLPEIAEVLDLRPKAARTAFARAALMLASGRGYGGVKAGNR